MADRGPGFLDRVLKQGDRARDVAIVLHGGFDTQGRLCDPECTNGPRGPLQRMRQRSGVSGNCLEPADQIGALSREKPENFGFKRSFAEGHAPEMLDVDGGLFWNERW